MKNSFKRYISILLALVLLISLLPANVVHAAERKVAVSTATELFAAINKNARDGDVIVLTADIETDTSEISHMLKIKQNITLDLNGKTLSYRFTNNGRTPMDVQTGGKLTICDSSAAGAGMIKGVVCKAAAAAHLLRNYGGTLVINGGVFCVEDPNGANPQWGNHVVMTMGSSQTRINAGTFTAYASGYTVQTSGQEGSTCVLYGGSFSKRPNLSYLAVGHRIVQSGDVYQIETVDVTAGADISGVFSVGYGREDITPSEAVPMAGYGNTGMRPSTGVDSNLYTTCVAFSDGDGNTVLLFHNDLIKCVQEVTERARKAVSRATGVAYDNVLVAATHTHSGPDTGNTAYASGSILRYNQQLVDSMVDAAIAAMRDRKSAQIYTSDTQCEGLNFVRHYRLADGSYAGDHFGDFSAADIVEHTVQADATMQLVKFAQAGGKDIVLANWQVHPHGIGSSNTLISADLVGLMRAKVEKELGCNFIYFTGASGNISSTSKITKENVYTYTERGNKMGEYAVAAAENFKRVNAGAVSLIKKLYRTGG